MLMITTLFFVLHIAAGLAAYAAELLLTKKDTAQAVVPLISASTVLGTLLALSSAEVSSVSVALHALVYLAPLAALHFYRQKAFAMQQVRVLGLASASLALVTLLGK